MTTDSELSVLQEKVKRLTHDRDLALSMTNRASRLLQEMKTQKEHYAHLWESALIQVHKLETQTFFSWLRSRYGRM